jgi:hypothetical protein
MALTDINFQEGEGQDFMIEIPAIVYSGAVNDVLVEADGSQNLILETPQITGGSENNIFIMSE